MFHQGADSNHLTLITQLPEIIILKLLYIAKMAVLFKNTNRLLYSAAAL